MLAIGTHYTCATNNLLVQFSNGSKHVLAVDEMVSMIQPLALLPKLYIVTFAAGSSQSLPPWFAREFVPSACC
jgi:hypothetical protein